MRTSPTYERSASWGSRSPRWIGWVVVGVCWLRHGWAAPEQEPIRLEYVADEGCPSAAEFERMVFERTHSARPAHADEVARLFSVTLERDPRTVRGSLTVRDGEQTLVRQVNGRDCADLASVLALATALAIDPSAELLPPGSAPGTTDTSGGREGSKEGEPPRESEPTPTPAPVSQDVPVPYDPPDALPSGASVELLGVAAGVRAEWAATPYPALGPALSVDFGDEDATWTFGAAASLLFTASKEVATARADFRIIAATLNACSLAFRWQVVQAGGCLQGDFGDIYATSSDIPLGESAHRFWATIGVHLKLVTRLSDDWGLALDVGPNLLLTQYRFEFNEPDTRVFQQGTWSGSTRLMLDHAF